MSDDYPDIETVALDWLESNIPVLAPSETARYVDTVVPPDLQELVAEPGAAFVWVRLVTGVDDGITDRSVLDIDVLSNSRDTSYAVARDIRSRFTGQPHRVGTVVIDKVVTEEKPTRRPWVDETIQRFGATYRISARR